MGGWRVRRALGVGAVTVTLEVERDGELRAAKRLLARFAGDPEASAMLLREGSILLALSGRGAPRVVDRGEDGDGPFVVMELSALPSLGARVACQERPRAAWLRLAALSSFGALSQVHEATAEGAPLAVVHADLTPDNLLVGDDGRDALIVDFGLSHFRDDAGPSQGPFRGTVGFAAPEVARGAIADERSDLFGLAATLLATASGAPPRRGADFAALLREAAEAPIDAYVARASAGMDPALAKLLTACARFEPGERPSTAREALALLGDER
jgi:serine/threonine-protein kinase